MRGIERSVGLALKSAHSVVANGELWLEESKVSSDDDQQVATFMVGAMS